MPDYPLIYPTVSLGACWGHQHRRQHFPVIGIGICAERVEAIPAVPSAEEIAQTPLLHPYAVASSSLDEVGKGSEQLFPTRCL